MDRISFDGFTGRRVTSRSEKPIGRRVICVPCVPTSIVHNKRHKISHTRSRNVETRKVATKWWSLNKGRRTMEAMQPKWILCLEEVLEQAKIHNESESSLVRARITKRWCMPFRLRRFPSLVLECSIGWYFYKIRLCRSSWRIKC